MNRSSKNIILIIILALGILGLIFTISSAKSNNESKIPSMGENMMGNPPEKPDGENMMGNPPEKPDGENMMGNPPEMPNTTKETSTTTYLLLGLESSLISLILFYLVMSKFNEKSFGETFKTTSKILIYAVSSVALIVALVWGSNSLIGSSSSNMNNPNGSTNNSTSYKGKTEIKEATTISSGSYESTTADENAILATDKVDVNISSIEVNKTGDSAGGDNTSFYGTNSAILAKSGVTLNLSNVNVTTNATGSNGVFSYGGSATTNNSSSDGTTVNISDSTIVTTKDNSGGIMTTGGGIMNASNLKITTAGTSSAAIRSDRGGGTVNVDGGTYKTTGKGSPAIYSTANITVKNAELISEASEGAIIEGKNSITLDNVTLTDTNNILNGQSTTYKNIFLYQSMSGDAEVGCSTFTASNSTIITNKGDTLYVTNTTSTINLTNNTIINNDATGNFLRIQADSWGKSGSNGGIVTLLLNNQTIKGNIVVDSISTLDMSLTSSNFEGAINTSNTAKSIKLTLDKDSKITLTKDSYISSLDNADLTNSNINFNGHKLYVDGKAIN